MTAADVAAYDEQRMRTLLTALLLCLLVLGAAACGGTKHTTLESLLAKGSISFSDGTTRTYKGHSASCGNSRRIAGRRFYLCRIEYRPIEGTPPPAHHESVCAALDPSARIGYALRALRDCR